MASSEQWPGKMATGDVNIQRLLQNDPNKRVRDYKPIERRKPPVINLLASTGVGKSTFLNSL